MDASVIIAARNAAATLAGTLKALAAQRGDMAFEVIVVDGGSSDGTAAVAEAAALDVRVIRCANVGPAAARNAGAAAAGGRVLAFTDADCAPAPGWLAAALAATENADVVQGRVVPPPGAAAGPYDRLLIVLSEYGLYETANLVVRRELFERLGGFEAIIRPRADRPLGEDTWLGWRARRAGARTAFCEAAVVHHAVEPRGPRRFVAERARLAFFPELVARIPELRDGFLYRRVFLNRRTGLFDLALAGALTAALRRQPVALAAAVPYAAVSALDALRWRINGPAVMAVGMVADLVGLAALAYGSLRARSPVL